MFKKQVTVFFLLIVIGNLSIAESNSDQKINNDCIQEYTSYSNRLYFRAFISGFNNEPVIGFSSDITFLPVEVPTSVTTSIQVHSVEIVRSLLLQARVGNGPELAEFTADVLNRPPTKLDILNIAKIINKLSSSGTLCTGSYANYSDLKLLVQAELR